MTWNYMSGFVDADGSLVLFKQNDRYYPRIGFHNTCLEILVQIEQFIARKLNLKGTLTHYLPRTDNGEVQYTLTYSSYKTVLPILHRLDLKHPKKMYRKKLILQLDAARRSKKEDQYKQITDEFRSNNWRHLVGA